MPVSKPEDRTLTLRQLRDRLNEMIEWRDGALADLPVVMRSSRRVEDRRRRNNTRTEYSYHYVQYGSTSFLGGVIEDTDVAEISGKVLIDWKN